MIDLDSFFDILNILSQYKVLGVDVCGEPDFNLIEIKRSEKINLMIHDIFKMYIQEKVTA